MRDGTATVAALVLVACSGGDGGERDAGTCEPPVECEECPPPVECEECPPTSTCDPATTTAVVGRDGSTVCIGNPPLYPPTVCDPATTIADDSDGDGVITCIGIGTQGCVGLPPCPGAAAGHTTVCGRLVGLPDGEPLIGVGATGSPCGSGSEVIAGPCQLALSFYDAVAFATNPGAATPLLPQSFYFDDCGRFIAENIELPDLGMVGIGVDDMGDDPAPPHGEHRLTAVTVVATSGSSAGTDRVRAYIQKTATDVAWSVAMFGEGQPTFGDRGGLAAIFLDARGQPVNGVNMQVGTNDAPSGNDFYFLDTEPFSRMLVDPDGPADDNRTGPNGVALLINATSLGEHGGEGGGCTWPITTSKTIPGVTFVAELRGTCVP